MKLFNTATAKLSREVLEILQVRDFAAEVEKLCRENEVLLNHDQDTSDIEVTGSFHDLIFIYNSLSEYLKNTHGISADHFEICNTDVPPQPSEIENAIVEWDTSLPRKEEIKEEKSRKNSSIPEPIVLSINLNEFSTSASNEVTDDQSEGNQTKDTTDFGTSPDKFPSTAKDIKAENLNLESLSVVDEQNNLHDQKVTRHTVKRKKQNNKQHSHRAIVKDHADVKSMQLKGENNEKSLENKDSNEDGTADDEFTILHGKQSLNIDNENDAPDETAEQVKNNCTLDTAAVIAHKQQGRTSCRKRKLQKTGSKVTQKKAKPQKAKLNDFNEVEDDVENESIVELRENPLKNIDPKSTHINCPENGCKYIAKEKKHLSDHYARNHKDKLYKCSQCDMTFSVKKDLNKHEKLHGDLQYCCEDCGKMYRGEKAYLQHKKSHEKGYVKPEFLCGECGKSFSTKYVLQYHVKSEHLGIKKSFLCPTCGKSFTQKYSYILHANVHLGIRPYVCEICGDSFPYEKSLKEHKYMHDDLRRFQCKECGKKFRQPSALHTHMKIHKKSKEHLCGTCGKGFTQKQALLRHERIHSGDKPFSCNLCSRTFSDASIIRRHMIMVHKISPSEWRSEVTSNITSHTDFFVEMLDGDKQPQLKKKGRPPAKAKSQSQDQSTEPTTSSAPVNEQVTTTGDTTVDPRASAALTLSSLAVGGLESSTITKQANHLPAEPATFLQKPSEEMPCELQQISVPSSFLGINNYTAVPSVPLQVTSSRADTQPVLYSSFPTVTPTLPHIQTMDKDLVGPAGDAYQVEDPDAVRNDQWSTSHYPYMYLSNYSQFQQIQ